MDNQPPTDDHSLLLAELTRDEGLKLFVYDDANGLPIKPGTIVKGHPTIGIGRCLDCKGITNAEAAFLLAQDVEAAALRLSAAIECWTALDFVRRRVLVEMAFNLGIGGLLAFHTMLGFVAAAHWEAAADSMLQSHWAKQVGTRAERLAAMMRLGRA